MSKRIILLAGLLGASSIAACGSGDDEGGGASSSGGVGGDASLTGGSGGGGGSAGQAGTTSSGGAAGAAGSAGIDSGSPDSGSPDAGADADAGQWPATGPCFGIPVTEMGVLPLDGTQQLSSGLTGGNMLIAKIIAPPSGSSSVAMYEYATPSVWRKAWLSENRCDMSAMGGAGFAQGIGPNLYFTTTPGDAGGWGTGPLVMIPGHTYYLMLRNLTLGGQPSCPVNQVCDVAVKAYPPS